jgi:hypothetical protein
MKNLIKISALVAAIAGFSFGAKAQTTNSSSKSVSPSGIVYSIGVDGGLPTGNFSNGYNASIGGSLQVDIPVVNQLYVTVTAGYNYFYSKDNAYGTGTTVPDIQLLPVKAGLKFFPFKYFYIQGEAGAAFALNKSDLNYNNSAAFIYAPQVGVQIPVGGRNYIDAGVRYEASTKFNSAVDNSTVNFVGLRIAYAFSSK